MELRYNNQQGYLGASMSSTGLTINFGQVPTFNTIGSGDYIKLVLDNSTASAEYVYLTGYTAGASTGTVQRAAENGFVWPAVAHAQTTGTWAHVPTATDYSQAVLGGSVLTQYPPGGWSQSQYGFGNASAGLNFSSQKGSTPLNIINNQTLGILPRVSNIVASSSVWTVSFTNSIVGTHGEIGDTFPCYTQHFTPTTFNAGAAVNLSASAQPLIATVTGASTCTIPYNAAYGMASVGSPTVIGDFIGVPIFETPVSQFPTFPRAMVNLEGTVQNGQSINTVYAGLPAFQHVVSYQNTTPATASVNAVNGSNVFTTSTVPNGFVVGMNVSAPGLPFSTASVEPVVGSIAQTVGGAASITVVNKYPLSSSGSAVNWTGSSGVTTLTFAGDMQGPVGFINAPIMQVVGSASVDMVPNPANYNQPGAGGGWSYSFADDPVFAATQGGALNNIQIVGAAFAPFLVGNANSILRYGVIVDDMKTKAVVPWTPTGTNYYGTAQNQTGLVLGSIAQNGITVLPYYGATNNIGLVNGSTTFFQPGPAITTASPSTYFTTDSLTGTSSSSVPVLSTQGFCNPPTAASCTISSTTSLTTIMANGASISVNTTAGWPQVGMGSIATSGTANGFGGYHTFTYTSITATSFQGVQFSFPSIYYGAYQNFVGTNNSDTVSPGAAVLPTFLVSGGPGGPFPIINYKSLSASAFNNCQLLFDPDMNAASVVTGSGASVPAGTGVRIAQGLGILAPFTGQCLNNNFIINASYTSSINLTAAASVTCLTSGPVITGVNSIYTGQVIHLINGSTTAPITFLSNSASTPTQLLLGQPTRTINPGGSLSLIYKVDLVGWVETGFSPGPSGWNYNSFAGNSASISGGNLASPLAYLNPSGTALYNAASDTQPSLIAGVINLGTFLPGLFAGPGGSVSADTNFYRTSAGTWVANTFMYMGGISSASAGSGIGGTDGIGRWVGTTASAAPTLYPTAGWARGDWVTTLNGQRYTCTTAGSPGTWVPQSNYQQVSLGASVSATSGKTTLITSSALAVGTYLVTGAVSQKSATSQIDCGFVAASGTSAWVQQGLGSLSTTQNSTQFSGIISVTVAGTTIALTVDINGTATILNAGQVFSGGTSGNPTYLNIMQIA